MKCKCLDTITEKLDEKILSNLKDYTDYKSVLQGVMLSFTHGTILTIPFKYEFRQQKKDGTPFKNKTKEETSIKCSFCPFCGKKTTEENDID